jgi:hypothetical protein
MPVYKNLQIFKKYSKCKELEKLLCFKCFVWMPDDEEEQEEEEDDDESVWIETYRYVKCCSFWNRVLFVWCI